MRYLAVVALIMAACGGSEIDLGGDVTVSAVEFEFRPASIAVAPGAAVTFQNAGSIAHEWVVLTDAITDEEDFERDLALVILEAEPGQSLSTTIDLEPGSYQVVCAIEGHLAAGMEGTMVVEG